MTTGVMYLTNDNRLSDLLKAAGKLGKVEGQGGNSRHELAIQVTQAAQDGAISVGKDPVTGQAFRDVEAVWSAFQDARASALGNTRTGKEPSFDVQVSKLGVFAKAGVVAAAQGYDAVDVMTRARALINTTDDVKGSTFDNMVKVARVQIDNDHAQVALTDGDILEAILPKEAEEKEEIDLWKAELKRLEKMRDGSKPSEDGSKPGKPGFPSPELDQMIEIAATKVAALEILKADAEHAKKKAELQARQSRLIPAARVTPASAPAEPQDSDELSEAA